MRQTLARLIFHAATFLTTLACAIAANATEITGKTREYICPYDGTKYYTNRPGILMYFATRLDLEPISMIGGPGPLMTCSDDGFVLFKSNFTDEELAKLRPLVKSDGYQALRKESTHYRAAWLLEHSGGSHWDVTWALINAAWERREYIDKVIERLPQDISEATGEKKTERSLLYGEFLRQLGRFQEAEQFFTGVLEKIDPFSIHGLITRYEISLVKAQDKSRNHTQTKAIKMFENDPDYLKASRIPNVAKGSGLQQSVVFEMNDIERRSSHNLVWSNDASTVFSMVRNRIVTIDANKGEPKEGPSFACQNCTDPGFVHTPKLLLSAGGSVFVLVWDRDKRLVKKINEKSMDEIASHNLPDFLDPALLSYDKTAVIYDIGHGIELRDMQTNSPRFLGAPPATDETRKSSSWYVKPSDPSGPRLVFYYDDRRTESRKNPTLAVWDYSTNTKVMELNEHSFRRSLMTASVAFSPDGNRLFVAENIDEDTTKGVKKHGEIGVWDAHTGQLLNRHKKECFTSVSASPDGRFLAIPCGQTLSVMTSDMERTVATLDIRGDGGFSSVVFSPDAKSLAIHTGKAIVIYKITE